MKFTKENLKSACSTPTKMALWVIDDVIEHCGEDLEEVKTFLSDVGMHGCRSGIVSSLITYSDTTKFFREFVFDIDQALADLGIGPDAIIGYDEYDPLCLEQTNQNVLAWFGYEIAASQILEIIEEEVWDEEK